MIKGLLFDLNGTVVDIFTDENNFDVYRIMANLLDYQGVYVYPEELRELLFRYTKEQKKISSEKYPEFDSALVFKRVLEELGGEVTKKLSAKKREFLPQFLSEAFRAATRFKLDLYPHVRHVLDELKQKYRLAAVSDGQTLWAVPEMTKVGLKDYFEFVIVSGDLGFRKPDVRMYQKALQKMKLKPEEVIFIGNDMYRDVFGAHQAGMKTVFFKSNQGDFESNGVDADYVIYDFSQLPEAIEFLSK